MTEIPDTASAALAGLVHKKTTRSDGSRTYYARYRVDGKQRLKALGTTDITEAVALRDAFYRKLREQGATVMKWGSEKMKKP